MHATKLVITGLLCAAAFTAADARNVLRCSGSIVDTGMTVPEVLAKCGEPESREVASVPIRARGVQGATYVVGTATLEHWTYQRRPGQFPAYLTFDQGRLRSIEFLYRR